MASHPENLERMSGVNPIFMEPIPERPGVRLAESMADHFKKMISKGLLKAGDKLPTEHQLCDYYSVSRSTLRESMQILRAHGFLDVSPGRGSFVKVPESRIFSGGLLDGQGVLSDKDYDDAIRAKRGLLYAAFVPLKHKPKVIYNLMQAHEILLSDSAEEICRKDHAWKMDLMRLSGNPVLERLVQQLLEHTKSVTLRRFALEEHRMQMLTKQQALLSCLSRGDISAAERFFSLF